MNSEKKKNSDYICFIAALYLVYASWANVSGWFLSGMAQLNAVGYLLAVLPLFYVWYRLARVYVDYGFAGLPQLRRARTYEIAWIAVVFMIIVGALVNRPIGWDAFAYRLPRVLRWLAENQWHWINSADDRQDISAPAFEWMAAPLYALFRTDRMLFLINLVPYLCMPRLCWLASRAQGVSRQWSLILSFLVPLGFCFALQAGGVSNDGLGAFFALLPISMLHGTGFRWLSLKTKFACACLSLAILTGLKLSNLPLAGVIFLWIVWKHRKQIPSYIRSLPWVAVIAVMTLLCSIVPVSVMNHIHTGHWSGDPDNTYKHKATSPPTAILANALFCLTDAISPNPFANRMNQMLVETEWINDKANRIKERHPNFKYFKFSSYGYDASSGPSTPLMILLPLLAITGLLFFRKKKHSKTAEPAFLVLVITAYVFFLASVAVHGSQRHAAPYYPLLVISVVPLFASRMRILPQWLLSTFVLAGSGVSLLSLMISPVRPLVPQKVAVYLDGKGGSFQFHKDAMTQGKILELIPKQRVFAVTHWGASTHRLWPPFFEGEVIEINSSKFRASMLKGKGYIYITEVGIAKRYGMDMKEFLRDIGKHEILAMEPWKDSRMAAETAILIKVDDLGKLPLSESIRLYPHQ